MRADDCETELAFPCENADGCRTARLSNGSHSNQNCDGLPSFCLAFFGGFEARLKTSEASNLPRTGFKGRINQDGEIRFYCKDGDEGTGDLSKAEGWKKSQEYGKKTQCETSPGNLISFNGGTGTQESAPKFWTDKNLGISQGQVRKYQLVFCCCPEKREVKLDFSPTKPT